MTPEIPWKATRDADGRLHFEDRAGFDEFCKETLGDGGEAFVVVWPLLPAQHHYNALRFYRGCVLILIADEIGEGNLDEAHDVIGRKFLPLVPDGKGGLKPKSTALDVMPSDEFCDFLDRVIAWAVSPDGLRIRIPASNRRWRQECRS